mgnify:CR=1 FL=1
MFKTITLISFILLLVYGISNAQLSNTPSNVWGQPDFNSYNSGISEKNLNTPYTVAVDEVRGKIYVSDFGNNRVLRFSWDSINITYPSAEMVFGQQDFISGSANRGTTANLNTLNAPTGVTVDNEGALYIADAGNNRILRFDKAYAATLNDSAEAVFGQSNFTSITSGTSSNLMSYPMAVALDEDTLYVSTGHRVLKFKSASFVTTNPAADTVFGQPDFTSNNPGCSASVMDGAVGVVVNNGVLYVAEAYNNRVLRFSNARSNHTIADAVFGQPNFTSSSVVTSSLNYPFYLSMDGNGTLYVADRVGFRVGIFFNASQKPQTGGSIDNSIPTTGNLVGVGIVNNYNSTGKLLVIQDYNNRILIFNSPTPLPVQIINFNIRTNAKLIQLLWQTATEQSNYGFEVERKSLNDLWQKVDFVQGKGTTTTTNNYQYTDYNVHEGKTYTYRLKQIDTDGKVNYSQEQSITVGVPTSPSLSPNYPNPFNPTTMINYQLAEKGKVILKVYNVLGKEVATLVNEEQSAGVYSVKFNASLLSSGVYFYKITSGSFIDMKKMVLLK